MLAYIAYIMCVVAIVALAYGIGFRAGQKERASINLSLIEKDACERCVYLKKCMEQYRGKPEWGLAELETTYCRDCAVNMEKIKH